MRLLIMFFILAAGYLHACAHTKTTRHNLKAARHATVSADASKLTPATDSLTISGYDKPLRSGQETLFVTNHSRSEISLVSVTITYTSVNGEMLHQRSINIPCAIPEGETRQLAFRSWDKQQAYYHHTTRVIPRSPKAIPYRAEIRVNGAIFRD